MLINRIRDILVEEGGLRSVAVKALRKPGAAFAAGRAVMRASWPDLLLGSEGPWRALREELRASGFVEEREQALAARFEALGAAEIRGRQATPGQMRRLHLELLYALVRTLRPERVVETGVCNGMSTAVLLHALERNAQGRLFSLDLPEFTDPARNDAAFWSGKGPAAVPGTEAPGWLAPEALRGRWSLTLGRSQDRLEPLLAETGPIDLFIHDSEHSYENQRFEFAAGYRALRPGGVLVTTDTTWSNAYAEFEREARRDGAAIAVVDAGCAVVRKPAAASAEAPDAPGAPGAPGAPAP